MEVKKEQLIYIFKVSSMQETIIIGMESQREHLKFILKVYVSHAKK